MRPAIFDARSFFDKAWWSCQAGGQLDGLSRQAAQNHALCAALGVLGPLFGPGSRLPFEVDHALFCWDGRPKTDKPRPPKPPGFVEDLARFKTILPAVVGAAHVTPDTEADDAVATAAFNLESRGIECVVVSADKDLQQLATPLVHYYCLNKRQELTIEAICQRWQVRSPREVGLALALLGDKSDGVSGVHGVGPIKCGKLFSNCSNTYDMLCIAEELANQLDPHQLASFWASVEATMLRVNLPGIPEPGLITLCSPETLDELGLGGAKLTWARVTGRTLLYQDVASSMDEVDSD